MEYCEHKQFAEDALAILEQYRNSMIAKRGVKLLSSLLEEIAVVTQTYVSRKRGRDNDQQNASTKSRQSFNVLAFVKSFSSGRKQSRRPTLHQENQASADNANEASNDIDPALMVGEMRPAAGGVYDCFTNQDLEMDISLFPQGFENATPFENLLYLANHDFSFFGG